MMQPMQPGHARPQPKTPLKRLNMMNAHGFVRTVGHCFENSPWVAERAFHAHPFHSVAELHEKMCAVVKSASEEEQGSPPVPNAGPAEVVRHAKSDARHVHARARDVSRGLALAVAPSREETNSSADHVYRRAGIVDAWR